MLSRERAEEILRNFEELRPSRLKLEEAKEVLIGYRDIKSIVDAVRRTLETINRLILGIPKGYGRSQIGLIIAEELNGSLVTPLELSGELPAPIVVDDAEPLAKGLFREELQEILGSEKPVILLMTEELQGFFKLDMSVPLRPERDYKELMRKLLSLYVASGRIDEEKRSLCEKALAGCFDLVAGQILRLKDFVSAVVSAVKALAYADKGKVATLLGKKRKPLLAEVIGREKRLSAGALDISITPTRVTIVAGEGREYSVPLDEALKAVGVKKGCIVLSAFHEATLNALLWRLASSAARLASSSIDSCEGRLPECASLWLLALGAPYRKYATVAEAKSLFQKIVKLRGEGLADAVLSAFKREGLVRAGYALNLGGDFAELVRLVTSELEFRLRMFR